jgi:hypothetical protein
MTSDNNWIYIGIFLDDSSRTILKNITSQIIDDKWKVYCHHMTIAFNDNSDRALMLYHQYKNYFGAKTEITATHIGISEDALAVKVDFKGMTSNKVPHITLATPIGGKPVNSNYITEWHTLDEPINLAGIISQFKGK